MVVAWCRPPPLSPVVRRRTHVVCRTVTTLYLPPPPGSSLRPINKRCAVPRCVQEMERLRQTLPTCSPAACCESEAADDPLEGAVVDELSLSYGNWMSDVSNRLWNIPLVRAAQRSLRGALAGSSLREAGFAGSSQFTLRQTRQTCARAGLCTHRACTSAHPLWRAAAPPPRVALPRALRGTWARRFPS